MKLKEFNAENTISSRSSIPSIGINQKTGLVSVNKAACELIGLSGGGAKVSFFQDEDEPQNWYIEKVKQGGFELRKKEEVMTGMMFNNSTLARQIGSSAEIDGSFKMLVAGEPTKHEKRILFGLLFRKP